MFGFFTVYFEIDYTNDNVKLLSSLKALSYKYIIYNSMNYNTRKFELNVIYYEIFNEFSFCSYRIIN